MILQIAMCVPRPRPKEITLVCSLYAVVGDRKQGVCLREREQKREKEREGEREREFCVFSSKVLFPSRPKASTYKSNQNRAASCSSPGSLTIFRVFSWKWG